MSKTWHDSKSWKWGWNKRSNGWRGNRGWGRDHRSGWSWGKKEHCK
jgi:hypothetical protein